GTNHQTTRSGRGPRWSHDAEILAIPQSLTATARRSTSSPNETVSGPRRNWSVIPAFSATEHNHNLNAGVPLSYRTSFRAASADTARPKKNGGKPDARLCRND